MAPQRCPGQRAHRAWGGHRRSLERSAVRRAARGRTVGNAGSTRMHVRSSIPTQSWTAGFSSKPISRSGFVREFDIVGRPGDDEFVVMVSGIKEDILLESIVTN